MNNPALFRNTSGVFWVRLNEPLENNRELKISKNFKQELLSAFYTM